MLTDEKWFTWNSDPSIESEDNTMKFSYNGYEKSIVTATNKYAVQCGQGFASNAGNETRVCVARTHHDTTMDATCKEQGTSETSCNSVRIGQRLGCQWRLICPAGVASTYDAKTKKDTCDYRDDVVVEKVNVTVTIGKDGAVEFDDDSGGCPVLRVPASIDWRQIEADQQKREEARQKVDAAKQKRAEETTKRTSAKAAALLAKENAKQERFGPPPAMPGSSSSFAPPPLSGSSSSFAPPPPPMSLLEVRGSFLPTNMFLYVGAARVKHSVFGGTQGKSIVSSVRVSGNGSNVNVHNGTKACPARNDCQVSIWGLWSQCTRKCGGGTHTRTRTVTAAATYGGDACPSLIQKDQPCNTGICGVDCTVTEWKPWGPCDRACADKAQFVNGALVPARFPHGGNQTRQRDIALEKIRGTHYGLKNCPVMNETRFCNKQYCGKDCIVGQWTPWSNCSNTCGGGAMQRYRSIYFQPDPGSHLGHDNCPPTHEMKQCNRQPCPRTPVAPTPKVEGSKCSKYSLTSKALKRLPLFLRGVGHAAAHTQTCSACIAEPECGWCPNSGLCLEGTPNGPIPKWNVQKGTTLPSFKSTADMEKIFMYKAKCSSWQYAECKPEPCREHAECNQCLADPYCGWCGMTGRCEEGNQAGSVGEYCPNGWIGSPMHSAWGSSLRDGSGGIGWSSSSLESENPSVGDNEDDDDNNNDVWLESATKQLKVLSTLPNICASDIRESREIQTQKVNEEIVRQKLLRASRESCLPCNGTWPYCDCGGNAPDNFTALHFKHVVRDGVGVS